MNYATDNENNNRLIDFPTFNSIGQYAKFISQSEI